MYEKINETDSIGNGVFRARMKNKETKLKKGNGTNIPKKGNKVVNLIEADNLLNNDNYLYIYNKPYTVFFDTGVKENYISRKVVGELKLEIFNLKKARKRFVCLKKRFFITECAKVNFTYN